MTEATVPNPMDTAQTESLRTASLQDMLDVLERQNTLKTDFVATAASLSYQQGLLVAREATPAGMDESGDLIEDVQLLTFRPTDGFEDDVSERLGIPNKYVEKMRQDAVAQWNATNAEDGGGDMFAADLLDHNVNHWLQRDPSRTMLVRCFHSGDEGEIGVARALRSDSFGMFDHMDMIAVMLQGAREAGVNFEIRECRLTPAKLHVRIAAPEITAAAPTWLRGYRSPFGDDGAGGGLERGFVRNTTGARAGDLVGAGVDFRNSETGDGSWWIAPWIEVYTCGNGQTVKRDAFRKAHKSSRMEEGVIHYRDDTYRKELELIKLQSRDTVASFLNVDYLERIVGEIEEKAGAPVKDVDDTIKRVVKKFSFSEQERNTIFEAFVQSGQVNAGGVMHAVTAAAQVTDSPARATYLEEQAFDVLDFVAAS